jgi:hypothetical protein
MSALAKDGGNSGGGNGGGNGNGNGGSHGAGNQGGSTASHGNSGGKSESGTNGKSGHASGKSQSTKTEKAATDRKEKSLPASLAGLNSLKRNYRALMHTSDPRMTAIAAYATAYAQYELDNGTEPASDDPILGDEALEEALAAATKTGTVSQAVLEEAKTILGVGDAVGKIDQIRNSLAVPVTDDAADE